MAVYVIADTHFGHNNIVSIYSRQHFNGIDDHDAVIADNILSLCGSRDTLYLLGDVCIHRDSFHYVEEIAKAVENLYIVLGNHDFERSKAPKLMDYIALQEHTHLQLLGMRKYKQAWLTHAPIHPDELRGRLNIHGHMHDVEINDERYVNVSCECVDYKPLNIESIFEQKKHLLWQADS